MDAQGADTAISNLNLDSPESTFTQEQPTCCCKRARLAGCARAAADEEDVVLLNFQAVSTTCMAGPSSLANRRGEGTIPA